MQILIEFFFRSLFFCDVFISIWYKSTVGNGEHNCCYETRFGKSISGRISLSFSSGILPNNELQRKKKLHNFVFTLFFNTQTNQHFIVFGTSYYRASSSRTCSCTSFLQKEKWTWQENNMHNRLNSAFFSVCNDDFFDTSNTNESPLNLIALIPIDSFYFWLIFQTHFIRTVWDMNLHSFIGYWNERAFKITFSLIWQIDTREKENWKKIDMENIDKSRSKENWFIW